MYFQMKRLIAFFRPVSVDSISKCVPRGFMDQLIPLTPETITAKVKSADLSEARAIKDVHIKSGLSGAH
jgi:hypothetical protein